MSNWHFQRSTNHRKSRIASWLKRTGVAAVFMLAALALTLGSPLISTSLIGALEIFPTLDTATLESATREGPVAIVILAAGRRRYAPEFGGQTVDELSLERIRYGADVARRTGLPVLVSGGLTVKGDAPLASLMAQVLLRDYALEAKWQETRSTTTAENAIYSAALLKRVGINRIVLVTHAWHMKRARDAFAANGIAVIPAPTAFYGHATAFDWQQLIPSMRALRISGYAVHEIVGGVWYALRYGY